MAVECNADFGNPPKELIWICNGSRVLPGAARLRVSAQFLIIENITDRDAGLYQCAILSTNGILRASITVNVIDPIPLPLISPNLPGYLPITFGQPVHLDCKNPQADTDDVYFSWIDPNEKKVSNNHTLEVAPDNIIPGVYRCFVSTAPGDDTQQSVIVTVLDTPPILVDPESNVQAIEQEAFNT